MSILGVPNYNKSLPILHGCCTIQVYEQVGETEDTVEWGLLGKNTLVDEDSFQELDKHQWFWIWNSEKKRHYVMRLQMAEDGRPLCWVEMGSEVLRLHSQANN